MLRRIGQALRPLRIVWITPELALGPRFQKNRVGALARAGIGSVVDLRSEARDDEAALSQHGLHFYHLPIEDRAAPTQAQLKKATKWVLGEIAAGRKVYVHCQSGIGRSPCLATAILVAMGYSLSDAYNAVRRQRPWASLSSAQRRALERFEHSLRPQPSPDENGLPD